MYIHGQSRNKSSTYRSWLMMKNRCLNPKTGDYKYYGKRGIKVCKRWHNYLNFREDMGEKPNPNFTIGRIDPKQGYSKKNCQWETRKQQSRNRAYCKLTLQKANKIRELKKSGTCTNSLILKFKISKTTLYSVLRGDTWN